MSQNANTILLVDDSVSFHTMIDLFLRQSSNSKYSLLSCTTAEDMFDILQKRSNELGAILLDISLPGMNGLTASEQIHSSYPHIPIIIITARLDKSLAAKAYAVGATDFLLKPFDGNALRSRIAHARSQQESVAI